MARKLVQIDESKCSGCGLCVGACHEGAIGMVNGKAKLLKKDLCDGIGDCLPVCPTGAIAFEDSGSRPWPVQIKLVSPAASFFKEAELLIAADCTAYAYAEFYQKFVKDRAVLIGCPKLDSVDYSAKLAEILALNDIKSVTVVRMEVPCCGGIERAVKTALQKSGKEIPLQVETVTTQGDLLGK